MYKDGKNGDQCLGSCWKDAHFIILKLIKCTMALTESVMCSALST